ncbi:U6 snRNA phosphodiesterase [Coccomyxa sp. Obi]|nr:U6 snRNA phosphodiesterase [Coccomyxa sp. Obi]
MPPIRQQEATFPKEIKGGEQRGKRSAPEQQRSRWKRLKRSSETKQDLSPGLYKDRDVCLPPATLLLAGFKGGAVPLLTEAEKEQKQDAHLGRIRTFPHVEGNYAAHVYITVPVPSNCHDTLEAILQRCKSSIPDLQPMIDADLRHVKNGAEGPLVQPSYHLSLSRVVPVRYPNIQPLLASLKEHLAKTERFTISFGQLEVFENDERTRSFMSLLVDQGCKQVCRAVRRTDKAFLEHGLQTFHKEPRPHVSLMWALGSSRQRLATLSQQVQDSLGPTLQGCVWEVGVTKIECRIGQRVHAVWEAAGR